VDIEQRIVELRLERGRCAEVIHAQLVREQLLVSLSTVKRVLDRYGLRKKKSPWKKYHLSGERPIIENPGNLLQMDSIHIMKQRRAYDRIYIVTLIDVYSRWTYAKAFERIPTHAAIQTAYTAQTLPCFSFQCIQTDNGPEFTKYFTTMIESKGMQHRHTRVRKPIDTLVCDEGIPPRWRMSTSLPVAAPPLDATSTLALFTAFTARFCPFDSLTTQHKIKTTAPKGTAAFI
jgi:DNA-directed RNA polymerase subunit H (RpoH/RPB5)